MAAAVGQFARRRSRRRRWSDTRTIVDRNQDCPTGVSRRARRSPAAEAAGRAIGGHLAAAGVQLALADDPQEQLLERGRRVIDREVLAAVPVDHVADLLAAPPATGCAP